MKALAKVMEMTDSLSNLSAGDSGSSLRDPPVVSSNDSNSGSRGEELAAAQESHNHEGSDISPDQTHSLTKRASYAT